MFRLSPSTPLGKAVSLDATDVLKLVLTTVDGSTAKRPHQAFLTLTDPTTGVEESFVFNIKDSGKAKVDLVCGMSQLLTDTTNICSLTKTYPTNS